MTSDPATVLAIRSAWEHCNNVASIGVFLGVLAEILHFDIIYKNKRLSGYKNLLDGIVKAGIITLIVSLIVETVSAAQVSRIGSAQFRRQEDRLQAAIKEQDRLTAYAAALTKAVAPRNPEAGSLGRALAPFSAVPAYIMAADDDDARKLARNLVFSFKLAKMPVEILPPDEWIPPSGITVEAIAIKSSTLGGSDHDNEMSHNASRILCEQLNAQDIDATSSSLTIFSGHSEGRELWNPVVPDNGLIIRIGPRPQAFFTDRYLEKALPPAVAERMKRQKHSGETSCD